jgi:hypothetical protein
MDRRVAFHIAYFGVDLPGRHLCGIERAEQIDGRPIGPGRRVQIARLSRCPQVLSGLIHITR